MLLASLALPLACSESRAQPMREVLGAGDMVRITVFRYPDLTTETRVGENGTLNVPLVGRVAVKGMSPRQAARDIAERMKRGKYILNPQVDVTVLEARSREVSVLGYVDHPGRYILEGSAQRVSDVLAMAGGLLPDAADDVVVTRVRGGKSESMKVDVTAIMKRGDMSKDIDVRSGDSVFVPKAPVVYVYGQVMRGGSYRLEPGMTVMQAIALAGGMTLRGSQRRVQLRHRLPGGGWQKKDAKPLDLVAANDVIYVRESIF